MSRQSFSVLMSVYVKETRECLEHCFSSLYLQSIIPNEIVLVLDGPLTGELYNTIDVWKTKLPIVIVKLEKNVGLGEALNIGLSHCKYELIARMDTDDLCMPFRFQKQLEQFKYNENLSICGTYILEFDKSPTTILSKRILPIDHCDIIKKCSWLNPFNHMTVMYKKSHILAVGGYIHLPWMEDWYLWLRLLANGYIGKNIPEFLVKAKTGLNMIERRSGKTYIKSEWELTKIKVDLGLTSWFLAIFIFLLRSIPRLLPRKFLLKLYLLARMIK